MYKFYVDLSENSNENTNKVPKHTIGMLPYCSYGSIARKELSFLAIGMYFYVFTMMYMLNYQPLDTCLFCQP